MTKEEIQKNSEHWYNKYKELENKIADIKANCDLAIEGRDIKIKELEKENGELRNNGFTISAMTEQQLKVAIEKGEQLESENAKLKQQIEKMKRHCNCKHRDDEGYCEVKRTYLMDLSYDGCDKWELEG